MCADIDKQVHFLCGKILAGLSISACSSLLGSEVDLSSFRMTGSTCINPAVGFFLQLIAAWGAGDINIFIRDVWPLLIPCMLGAVVGAFFIKKFYEPLLPKSGFPPLGSERR